jgi:hypothetical protein
LQEHVSFAGAAPSRYRHVSDESGRWLDCYFCPHCGSNLGLKLEAVPGIRSIPAGTFDDPAWLDPTQLRFRHIFTRTRRSWSDLTPLVEVYEHHFRAIETS